MVIINGGRSPHSLAVLRSLRVQITPYVYKLIILT